MKMLKIIIVIVACLSGTYASSQEGAIYVNSNKVETSKFSWVIKDTSNSELHFYLVGENKEDVGLYLTKNEMGFWNSEIDTFALNDSTLIIFINPFPDVVLKRTIPDPKIHDKMQPQGIGPFIYEKNENGEYLATCINKNDNGTMKVYFDHFTNNASIGMIEYYLKGELIETKFFEPNTNFLYINRKL